MENSTIYSMGTALDRARSHGVAVELLVSGNWIRGQVVAVDGHGVLLESGEDEHVVVRLESIMVVRIHAPLPDRTVPTQPIYA